VLELPLAGQLFGKQLPRVHTGHEIGVGCRATQQKKPGSWNMSNDRASSVTDLKLEAVQLLKAPFGFVGD
jgi:hypothetical protein